MESWKWIDKRWDPLNLRKGIYHSDNEYGIPTIRKEDVEVNKFLPFGRKEYDGTAHFFLDDYAFERVWNHPKKYLNILRSFDSVCSPDFSLYTDFPLVVQQWNTYRNRWCGRYWQENGISVIPTVEWSTPESYDFCFLGIEPGSTVAVSSLGVLNSAEATDLFIMGFEEMLEQVKPGYVHFYGDPVPDLDYDDSVCFYDNFAKIRFKELK